MVDKIDTDRVVVLHYRMTDGAGTEIDSSQDSGPISYLHGHGQILPGLEEGLTGREAGDTFTIEVPSDEGFGRHHDELVIEVPRDRFEFEPELGGVVSAQHPDGRVQHLKVIGVSEESVTLDGNHPLAGQDLVFEVTVDSVRGATAEEIAHGHSHDGHDHDGHAH
jgi:FKBP-type peptidyl-prolyl cis-trans isomerase SlyD